MATPENLWAPWRLSYVKREKKATGCVFCRSKKSKKDAKNLVLYRGKKCFVIMNLYPYNNGHIMVVPNRHVDDLTKLTPTESRELFELTIRFEKILRKELKAGGFNIGINLGEVAGAGIKTHLHMHIVPRWKGDTNFMPLIAQTKVISQTLESLYESLKNAASRGIRTKRR